MRAKLLLLLTPLLLFNPSHWAWSQARVRGEVRAPEDLGLTLNGLTVESVAEGSIAQSLRMTPGVTLFACEGNPIQTWEEVVRVLLQAPYSSRFQLSIKSRGRKGNLVFDLIRGVKGLEYARIAHEIHSPIDIGLLLKGSELVITRSLPRSPVAYGRIRPKDRIVSCAGKKVSSWEELQEALVHHPYAARFELTVKRGSREKIVSIDLIRKRKLRFAQTLASLRVPIDIGILLGNGLKVDEILPGSPARGKLEPDDQILEAEGQPVDTWEALRTHLSEDPIATKLDLIIQREGSRIDVQIPLSKQRIPSSGGSGGKTGEQTVRVRGRIRKYVLEAPSKRNRPLPLVVLLHGTNSRPEYMLHHWRPVAGQSAILVAPWGERNWPQDVSQDQDEPFILALIEKVRRGFNVDLSRIYLSGHSRGAFYSHTLGLQHGEIFAAAGLFAGGRRPPLSRSRRKAAFVIYHGELDESVPVSAGRNAHESLEQAGHAVKIHIEIGGTGNPGHHEMNRQGIEAIWNFFQTHPMKPLDR